MGSCGRDERACGFHVVGERVLSYPYTSRPVWFSFYVMRLGSARRLLYASPSSIYCQGYIPSVSSHSSVVCFSPVFSPSPETSLHTAVRSCPSPIVPHLPVVVIVVFPSLCVLPDSRLMQSPSYVVCRSPLWVVERRASWAVSARVRTRRARGVVYDVTIIYAYVPTLSCT